MILLSTKTILVATEGGRCRPVDVDRLRQDLETSFAASGIHEPWLASHIVAVVGEEGTLVETAKDGVLPAGEPERIVVRLLMDTGYPDVAAEFSRRRGIAGPDSAPHPGLPWNRRRVRTLVLDHLHLSPATASHLTGILLDKLTGLGFADVSDELILELGRHALHELARAHREEPREEGGWLRPSGYWEAHFKGRLAELVSERILWVSPLSRLFPVPRVKLDMGRLARDRAPQGGLTELALFPALDECCACAQEAFAVLRQLAGQERDEGRNRPVHFQVLGLPEVIAHSFSGLSRARQSRLESEIRNHLEAALRTRDFPVLISMTN